MMGETFEAWDRKDREWTDRIRRQHEAAGDACPCGNTEHAAKLRRHLVVAHCFTADTWRLELAEAEHKRDHGAMEFAHGIDDLWEYIEQADA